MSQPILKPCFIAGTPRSSGDVQDASVATTTGGNRAASVYSGTIAGAGVAAAPGAVAAGDAVFFYSGAGRLNQVVTHVSLLSGQALTFYDTALAASGGPIPTSGHKVLFVVPAAPPLGVSGTFNASTAAFAVGMPFQSGLAVKAPSGCPGFTVSWTPEVSVGFPNA